MGSLSHVPKLVTSTDVFPANSGGRENSMMALQMPNPCTCLGHSPSLREGGACECDEIVWHHCLGQANVMTLQMCSSWPGRKLCPACEGYMPKVLRRALGPESAPSWQLAGTWGPQPSSTGKAFCPGQWAGVMTAASDGSQPAQQGTHGHLTHGN